ncbi:Gypsy retrotransposon integrase-like protein 1, variant 2 [Stygiomarasmius scandens]
MEEEIDALQHKLYQQSQSTSSSPGQVDVTSSHSSSNQPFPSPFLDSTLGSNTQQNADSSSLTGLSDKLKRLVIDQSLQRHFGTSSSLTLVKTAMDINDIQIPLDIQCPSSNSAHSLNSRRPEFWAIYPWQIPPHESLDLKPLVFPDRDLIPQLVDFYFVRYSQFLPFLHRPTFERSIAEGLHHRNRQFGYTVLAVCAVGSRYSDDPRIFADESAPEFSAGWKWFRQVKVIPETFTTVPTIYHLQVICLAILFLQATSMPEQCWTVLAVGIRLAQEVGAHRRRPGQTRPTIEGELWKRVFWMLYGVDIYMSAFLGRPRATSYDDFDLDLPIECDDEYWESSDPELAFVQPPGRPSDLVYWTTFLKLLDICSLAQRTIYCTRKSDLWTIAGMSSSEWTQRTVSELDSMLNNWIDTIPEHLKWDPNREDPNFFHQSVSLYVTYYWIQILVHKPFIPRPGVRSEVTFPSMAICANAARSACHVMEVQQRRGSLPLPNVLVTLYNAAIVLILNAWRGKQQNATSGTNKELVDVYKCIGMIRSYENRWQSAGTFCDVLHEIISISNVYNPGSSENSASSLKRSRNDELLNPAIDSNDTSGPSQFETRKIAGTNRATAAKSSSNLTGPKSMALPHPFIAGVQPDNSLYVDPIFNLPLTSNELGSLPLHESFDPFGDVQSFAHCTDLWMDELNALGSLASSSDSTAEIFYSQSSQGNTQSQDISMGAGMDSGHSQQMIEALLYATGLGSGAAGRTTVSQQSMVQDDPPVPMMTNDLNSLPPNLDDLLRTYMPL